MDQPTDDAASSPQEQPMSSPQERPTSELPALGDEPAEPEVESASSTPRPLPRHAAPAPDTDTDTDTHPRRWFLAGTGVAILAAAGGVSGALLRTRSTPTPTRPPAVLLSAITAEQTLIADLDATTGGTPQIRRVLVQARADHAAHLLALRGALARYDTTSVAVPAAGSAGSTSTTSGSAVAGGGTGPVGVPRTVDQLRRAERQAAARAASDAADTDGSLATLLASISACESTHAALLS